MGCVLHRWHPAFIGAVPPVFETKPVLLAEHAFYLLADLDLFPNEISARVRAFRSRGGSSLSYPSVRNRPRRGARSFELYLPTICSATPLDLVCRACYCTVNFTLARAFLVFLQRICIEHDPPAIARRVCRTLRPSVHRMHICNAADRKRHTFHRGRIVDAVEKENGK